MDKRNQRSYRTALPVFLSMLGACVSHQPRPDSDLLITSDNCEIVNGRYIVGSEFDKNILTSAVFGSKETVDALEIEKSDLGVAFRGISKTGQVLKREIPQRFSCRRSILTVVLDDQGGGSALISTASDTKLELFSTDENSLTLRFIDSALTFVFIVPTYQSEDYEVILERVTGPSAN